jgi:hypothetical protein
MSANEEDGYVIDNGLHALSFAIVHELHLKEW